MGKPVARKKAARAAAKRAGDDDGAPAASVTDHTMTKKQRLSAVRESREQRTAAKRKVRSTPAAETSDVRASIGGEAAASPAIAAANAFAPARAAKVAAAAMRAQKKAAFVRHATHRRNSTMTTNNLSDRERHRIITSELTQVSAVASHPAYQSDPLAALEAHLAATAERLQPQTPDIGRKAVAVKHSAARR
jgi:hypothetical protein